MSRDNVAKASDVRIKAMHLAQQHPHCVESHRYFSPVSIFGLCQAWQTNSERIAQIRIGIRARQLVIGGIEFLQAESSSISIGRAVWKS